jgi:aryl-alcohol dehydrogenase-like predicted oxidoreductase
MSYGTPGGRPAWALPEEEARRHFRAALDAGINFFDTANVYSAGASEEITGRALRDMARREAVVVATKVFDATGPSPNEQGLSRKNILHAIDASLKRLGTDYVDLYQIHRFDPETPVEETLEALHDIVKAGKVRYLGASSMPAWQFQLMQNMAERHGWTRFVSMQNQYNLAYREEEREMLPYCAASGVGVLPWSPLARGLLAGTRKRDKWGDSARARSDPQAARYSSNEDAFAVAERTVALAAALGTSPAQIAYAWLLSKPAVTAPIIGVTSLPQLQDAVAAVQLRLSSEQIAALEEPYRPQAVMSDQIAHGTPASD